MLCRLWYILLQSVVLRLQPGTNIQPCLRRCRQRVKFATLQTNKSQGGLSPLSLAECQTILPCCSNEMYCLCFLCSPEYQAKWKHIELDLGGLQPQATPEGKDYEDQNADNTILEESLKYGIRLSTMSNQQKTVNVAFARKAWLIGEYKQSPSKIET